MAASDVHAGHDSPGAARPADHGGYRPPHTAADYAWEFLRRNPDYRADFERWARAGRPDRPAIDARWGLRFPADPAAAADTAEVFWRAEVAPGLVIPLEADLGEARRPWRELRTFGEPRRAEDGSHLRLPNGLQLLLRGEARPEGPLVVVLAFDRDYGLRLRAAQGLQHVDRAWLAPRTRLSVVQRRRLDRALFALDGSLNGDSYRAIAQALFGAAALEREPWKTASVRDVTIRLVRAGRALMRGGYLKLLKGGP